MRLGLPAPNPPSQPCMCHPEGDVLLGDAGAVGAVLALWIAVFVSLIARERKIGHGLAASGGVRFGIAGQTTDENDFIDRHGNLLAARKIARGERKGKSQRTVEEREELAEARAGTLTEKARALGAESAGGGDVDAELLQFGTGEAVLFAAREALDNFAKFADPRRFLAEIEERQAFLEARWREFEALGIVGEDFVVRGDGFTILLLLVITLTRVELGVGSELGFAVILQVVLEFRASEIILAGLDVAEPVIVEGVGGGCGAARNRRGTRRRDCARSRGRGSG